jgi:hypothetical protein
VNRTVVYMTNEHPFYMNMVRYSLGMLVSKLLSPVDIKVYVIRDGSTSTIERSGVIKPLGKHRATAECIDTLRDLGAEVIEKPPLDAFFHANRQYLGEIETDSLIYIDADTFIFDDVNKLFDAHADEDFVAAEAAWVRGRNYPFFIFDVAPGTPMLPFSSGVMLWNNGWHKDWATKLPFWMEKLKTREHPLGDWLYKQHDDCLLREEFSATVWAYQRHKWVFNGETPLRYGYFTPEEVQLVRYVSDMKRLGQQTIFHCYTPNWRECRNRLDGIETPKVPKMKWKKSTIGDEAKAKMAAEDEVLIDPDDLRRAEDWSLLNGRVVGAEGDLDA